MKLNLKAISEVISAVRDYLFPYEKISKNFLKINSENDLRIFIKEKSAFVTITVDPREIQYRDRPIVHPVKIILKESVQVLN